MLDAAQAKLQGAVRKALAALTAFMLSLILLTALLVTGFYLLVQAAVLALTPVIGEAAAMASVGGLCVLLLALFFWRMTSPPTASSRKQPADSQSGSSVDALRELIRKNPLEAALTAFAVGLAQQGDPRLRSLLMQGGMELMKDAEAKAEEDADTDAAVTGAASQDGPQESGSTRR